MKIETLQRIADAIKNGNDLPPLYRGDRDFLMQYQGKVIGKERARHGQHSVYTPKETRDFEKAVKGGASAIMARERIVIYRCSVAVHLTINDPVPVNWPDWMKKLARAGYIHDRSGADLDNREKAILDALNNTVYLDDDQVVQVYKFRHYSDNPVGFTISVSPIGLTKNDLENLGKMLR